MKPFSDNLVFFDAEFSSLNPYEGEILSIGLVKMNGEELYLELEFKGKVDSWVKENILPTLKQQKISRKEALMKIKKFIGDTEPYMISNVNHLDATFYSKLNKDKGKVFEWLKPFRWIPLDFATMLFVLDINPENYFKRENNLIKSLKIDTSIYKQHNALDDARLLRETYLKLIKKHR